MSEKFCLKWNDFSSNASKSFGNFRNEEYLHDVTLVSDDQYQISAHKLVLSASSDYFKNIFKSNKHSNTFLCLDGISSTDLDNILDYIYDGEVQIYQDHLDRFLSVAQRLKLQGLLSELKEEKEDEKKLNPNFNPPSTKKKPNKVKTRQPETLADNSFIQENNQMQELDKIDLIDIDQKLTENMEKNPSGKYSCKICSKTNLDKTNMKYHVESHMEGLSFRCDICGKELRSRLSFRLHQYRQHRLKN